MSAPTQPSLAIQIAKVKRTRKRIEIDWNQGGHAHWLGEPDMPLPSFGKAFDALTAVVAAVIHVPEQWASENLRITGIIMDEMSGAKTVQIICQKSLDDAMKVFAFNTPPRLLANPTEPGKYTPPLSPEHAELVSEAEEQAKLYVRGERSQGQLPIEDAEGDEDADSESEEDDDEPLPFETDEAAGKSEKRGRKAKSEPAGVH